MSNPSDEDRKLALGDGHKDKKHGSAHVHNRHLGGSKEISAEGERDDLWQD